MKVLSITIVVALMVLAMAGMKSSQVSAKDEPGSNSATTAKSAPASAEAPSVTPPHGQPGHVCDHGKPGHVCSAPSGPPANMPLGTGATLQSGAPLSITTQTAPPSTAPGMNPPHGQPNHRCDIGVGVPLDSPAGTGKSTPVNPQLSTTSMSSSTPSTAPTIAMPTAPGMNPPHGQPNHRCDIGVGVPLDSPAGTGKSNSLSPTPIQINPATGTNGASSTQKHVHNNADSLNSPPIRIVPAPNSNSTGK